MISKKLALTTLATGAAVLSFGLPANAQEDYPPAPTQPPTTDLPATGADDSGTIALIAASLLGAGGVMVIAAQSRRRA